VEYVSQVLLRLFRLRLRLFCLVLGQQLGGLFVHLRRC
jgi:hypothetical protein